MPPLYHTPSLFDGKICAHCHTWLMFSNFYPRKQSKNGFEATCKPCIRERCRLGMQRRRQLNPEYNKESCRRHYLKYRQEHINKAAKYRAGNLSSIRAKARDYHQAHKECANAGRRARYRSKDEAENLRVRRLGQREVINARQREYRKQNTARYRYHDKVNFAKRRSAEGSHNAQDEKAQYHFQRGLCYWCTDPVGDSFHIDHIIPLSKRGTNNAENICVSCVDCNQHKHNMMPEEWKKRLLKSRPSLTAHMSTLL